MTNPDNIVRVRARNGGRASVYEANGWAQAYSMGLLEGNGVTQNTSADMNVLVGGSTTKPDVVIAENPAGYKIALDLVTQQAVAITAPASNSRISAIVAYTDDLSLQSTETDITGSPASCGLIVVNGTTAATPAVPDDSQIRSAITADGATGSQASYCIIATVEVAAGTTIITDSQITNRVAKLSSSNVDFTTLVSQTDTEFPLNTNNLIKVTELTIKEAGKYLISGSGRAYRNTTGATIFYVITEHNNSQVLNQAFNWVISSGVDTARCFFLSRIVLDCRAGDKISLHFQNTGASANNGGISVPAILSAERIG